MTERLLQVAILIALAVIIKQQRCTTKKIIMAQEILDELKSEIAKARTSLGNIRGDIARIIAGLPTNIGLTAEEVAELKSDLQTLTSEADTLDKENEEAVESPEGDGGSEGDENGPE